MAAPEGPLQKEHILAVCPLLPALEQWLEERYVLQRLPAESDKAASFLAEHGPLITGLVTFAPVGVTAAQLEALPALQVISSCGVGLDKLPLEAARARGIAVGYTPDVLNDCVADTVFALMLGVALRTAPADRFVRAGRWAATDAAKNGGQPGPGFGLGRQVSGAKLGVLGLGRIGRTIAQRGAQGFGMTVRYHARHVVADVPWQYEPSLKALAEWCDFLVVITAGGPGTRHLVNAEILEALGPRGFLINVARGSVVDEQALIAALQHGKIAGAGLDVFENEPHVPAELLALQENTLLLPHLGSATEETRLAMARLVVNNLISFFANGHVEVSAL